MPDRTPTDSSRQLSTIAQQSANELPINLFANEVLAIRAGRQTQLRRVIEPQPDPQNKSAWGHRTGFDISRDGIYWLDKSGRAALPFAKNRYGIAGDLLWGRETWAHYQTVNDRLLAHGGAIAEVSDGLAGYRADGHDTIRDFKEHVRLMSGLDFLAIEVNGDRWRQSIHMPRWASRITLEITGIRAERVQDIGEEDVRAEGIIFSHYNTDHFYKAHNIENPGRYCFEMLWDRINAKRGYSWESNPWVFVIEFKRLDLENRNG